MDGPGFPLSTRPYDSNLPPKIDLWVPGSSGAMSWVPGPGFWFFKMFREVASFGPIGKAKPGSSDFDRGLSTCWVLYFPGPGFSYGRSLNPPLLRYQVQVYWLSGSLLLTWIVLASSYYPGPGCYFSSRFKWAGKVRCEWMIWVAVLMLNVYLGEVV